MRGVDTVSEFWERLSLNSQCCIMGKTYLSLITSTPVTRGLFGCWILHRHTQRKCSWCDVKATEKHRGTTGAHKNCDGPSEIHSVSGTTEHVLPEPSVAKTAGGQHVLSSFSPACCRCFSLSSFATNIHPFPLPPFPSGTLLANLSTLHLSL